MTQTTVLDSAAFVDESRDPIRDVSDHRVGPLISANLNGEESRVVRSWRLRFEPATTAQARRVLDHWEAAAGAPFEYNPPNGTATRAIYLGAPIVRWRSRTMATVSVELEEVPVE